MDMLTSEQIRAARALLCWDQQKLAETSKVSLPSIQRLETTPGPLAPPEVSIEAIKAALETGGIIFLDAGDAPDGGPGVRLRFASPEPASIPVEDLTAENDE
jgi:hypothetical protein